MDIGQILKGIQDTFVKILVIFANLYSGIYDTFQNI